MSLSKVIETARNELGVTESPPGSNRVKYWDLYDKAYQGQPWCVSFLWWVYQQAGERMSFFGGGKTASCGILLRWYKEQGLVAPVQSAQIGDIIILNFSGTTDTQHCGLVVDVAKNDKGGLRYMQTIEGNTSPGIEGSQNNGGCVALKWRHYSQVVGVCRPQYKEDDFVDDISGHWAEKEIRWAIEKGLLNGYSDGTMKPDKPVTRAELAVILKRLEDGRE